MIAGQVGSMLSGWVISRSSERIDVPAVIANKDSSRQARRSPCSMAARTPQPDSLRSLFSLSRSLSF